MSPAALKISGIISALGVLICVFIAIERYQTNAANVQAVNAQRQAMNANPMMHLLGDGQELQPLEPATPVAKQYALFFAIVFAACSIGSFIWLSQLKPRSPAPPLSNMAARAPLSRAGNAPGRKTL